ncbi:MAG TPA: SRPBCC domain-containing protein [Candidatus Angelobacter sp.]|nr:SRPBCC domain-containing protein [Candidatus Angelobacter sp.]
MALRGIYTEFESGERLGFSWKWDHEPSDTTSVTIIWERAQKQGSRLVLNHGSYPLDEDGRKRRQGHVEGWMYFLERLESFTK